MNISKLSFLSVLALVIVGLYACGPDSKPQQSQAQETTLTSQKPKESAATLNQNLHPLHGLKLNGISLFYEIFIEKVNNDRAQKAFILIRSDKGHCTKSSSGTQISFPYWGYFELNLPEPMPTDSSLLTAQNDDLLLIIGNTTGLCQDVEDKTASCFFTASLKGVELSLDIKMAPSPIPFFSQKFTLSSKPLPLVGLLKSGEKHLCL